jgi:hypothetical protein
MCVSEMTATRTAPRRYPTRNAFERTVVLREGFVAAAKTTRIR